MPKFNVKKSIVINAPVDKIYSILNDFNHWGHWSPWLILEPEVTVKVAEGGKYYEWQGNRIGSGNMKVVAEQNNESIDYDLTFLKPWKSVANVRFEVKSEAGGTRVNWIMDSSLPFFMFWMKKMMIAYVGMDFQRGLNLLKDYAEDGTIHSKMEFKGTSDFEGCQYLGIKTNCTMDELADKMKKDFGELWNYIENHQQNIAGYPFSQYHKWDMANGKVSYTSAVPVSEIPDDLPAGITSGTIPSTRVYSIKHTGPYIHLGNPWSALYSMQRAKTFKTNKKVDPFETYFNKPGEVSDHELMSEVHFPVN